MSVCTLYFVPLAWARVSQLSGSQGERDSLGSAEGLAFWDHICLVSLGTGDQSSQMTGMGTGLGEAKTVPTSQMMAAGMMTSARGPTAGSARQR